MSMFNTASSPRRKAIAHPTPNPDALASALRYGKAKSRQDVVAAMACCTEDFVLETLPFQMRAAGAAQTARDLAVFFDIFPDYAFDCEHALEGNGTVILSGSNSSVVACGKR